MPGQKPVAKFKAGQVSSAIWANSIPVKNGGTATILKATVQRRYKDNRSTKPQIFAEKANIFWQFFIFSGLSVRC